MILYFFDGTKLSHIYNKYVYLLLHYLPKLQIFVFSYYLHPMNIRTVSAS